MQHYYFAGYPTDDWHLANGFCGYIFHCSVSEIFYHHILSATTRTLHRGQGSSTPPHHVNNKRHKGVDSSGVLRLSQSRRGSWTEAASLRCISGLLECISTDITQFMLCAIDRIYNSLMVVFCFRYATPSNYHHDAWLLTGVEHRNACRVYHAESVSKMELILLVTFIQFMGLHMAATKCEKPKIEISIAQFLIGTN